MRLVAAAFAGLATLSLQAASGPNEPGAGIARLGAGRRTCGPGLQPGLAPRSMAGPLGRMALGSLFPKLALTIRLLGPSGSLRAGRNNDPILEIVRSNAETACQINALKIENRIRSGNNLREAD